MAPVAYGSDQACSEANLGIDPAQQQGTNI
jgi:hypothetical protein